MKIRRVVTGQTASGKSVFVHDAGIDPITLGTLPGYEFHRLWGSDLPPALPTTGTPPAQPTYFPSTSGYRFGFFSLPPNTTHRENPDPTDILAEMANKLPGMAESMHPDGGGMHITDSVDYDVVVSGEVWLELDDGAETLLKAGDCVVQNGTKHAWHNRSAAPCVLAICLLGAKRAR